ncbi:delta(14)-sterol reductase TM7SF2-like [Ptychodera flava]|uniref:delta(14)-sterol reductase TM7SF2-like n=1 Tax=Ptychodera flava TaxID=63121 RepID=UPI003969BC82
MPQRHKVGDTVMARWPGSKLWFPASVIGTVDNKYTVKFEDGSEFELDAKSVNTEVSFRPRSRSRSPARRRSTGRRRSKSPSRRRSPSPKRQGSPARRNTTETKKEVLITSTPKSTVTKTIVSETTRTYITRSVSKKGEGTIELPVDVRSGRVPKTRDLGFGGSIGCILATLLYPVLIFYLYVACNRKSCSILEKPTFAAPSEYFDTQASLQYLGLILFLAILSMLPLGQVFEGPIMRNGQRMIYRKNGLCMLIITVSAFCIAAWYEVPVTAVHDHCLQYLSISVVISCLLSLVLYVKARIAPGNALAPQGNSGKIIYDMFAGHELHPRLKMIDFKMFMYRMSFISMVLLTLSNVGKMCENGGQPSAAILLASALQCWYALDSLWYEDRVVFTSYFQEYGCGFDHTFGCLTMMPFGLAFTTQYLVLYSVELQSLKIAALLLTQLVAMAVYRLSNSQKWDFRQNPYNPKLAHLESIATSAETRLLVSGWWGLVRHPNYLGSILLSIAWSLPCGFSHILPWLYTILGVCNTVCQERNDYDKCKRKYGAAWARYCQKVKYRLVPFLY